MTWNIQGVYTAISFQKFLAYDWLSFGLYPAVLSYFIQSFQLAKKSFSFSFWTTEWKTRNNPLLVEECLDNIFFLFSQ